MEMRDLSFLLYFLPVMLAVYFILSFSVRAQNAWLVMCSLGFYALGNAIYLPLLAGMVALNYLLGRAIHHRMQQQAPSKRLATLGVCANLLPLFALKYLPVLLGMVMRPFGAEAPIFPAAPLGIAFLALQGISYLVDTARGKTPWNPNVIDTALYLVFFPFLRAGPLLRYQDVAAQLAQRKATLGSMAQGLCRFVVGLGKVVLLATPLMRMADIVFEQSNNSGLYANVPVFLALVGLAACTLGVYHHFSGFTDLVLGLGGMLGFQYPENFHYPIVAASFTSFWKRFYTSLLVWFDEYVYQTLGKKRSNNDHMVLHLLLMWLLIGLWMGPESPNIIFALICFVIILIERVVEVGEGERESRNPIRHLYVLFAALLLVVCYRTGSIYQFTLFIGNLFGMRGNGLQSQFSLLLLRENWPALVAGLVACLPIAPGLRRLGQKPGVLGSAVSLLYPAAVLALAALVLLGLSQANYNPYLMITEHLWS